MIYDDIGRNKRNTFFLLFLFFIVIGGLGYLIGRLYGDPYVGIAAALVVSVASMFTSFFYGDKIVLSMSGAERADPKIHVGLFNAVENMSIAAGLKVPDVYVIPNGTINAFATGRDPHHSSIAVTEGTLAKLNKLELESVIAHEMSHVKNYDILVGSVAAVLVGAIVILSDFIKRGMFRSRSRGRAGVVFLIVAILAAIAAPFVGMIINYSISRQREYLADANAALLTRFPQGMIDVLEKIKKETYEENDYNKGIQHLYLTLPGNLELESLFASHPPVNKRIERLKTMLYNQQQTTGQV